MHWRSQWHTEAHSMALDRSPCGCGAATTKRHPLDNSAPTGVALAMPVSGDSDVPSGSSGNGNDGGWVALAEALPRMDATPSTGEASGTQKHTRCHRIVLRFGRETATTSGITSTVWLQTVCHWLCQCLATPIHPNVSSGGWHWRRQIPGWRRLEHWRSQCTQNMAAIRDHGIVFRADVRRPPPRGIPSTTRLPPVWHWLCECR